MQKVDDESKNVEILVRTMKIDNRYSYDLYDNYGNVILEAHTPITDSILNHLKSNNIEYLYYDPEQDSEENVPGADENKNAAGLDTNKSIISEELQQETFEHSKDFLEHIREVYNYGSGQSISKGKINSTRTLMDKILDNVQDNKDGIFSAATKFKDLDDYTYLHSTNVSILSAIFGSRADFNKDSRQAMGVGALFHDLGKSSISKEIITKAKLSDEEFDMIKEHPHVGHKLVEGSPHVQDLEKQIILLHHERADGEGYPFGFELDHYRSQVPREVRLFSLCNEYILHVLKKPGEKQLTSSEALRFMLNQVQAPYKKAFTFLPKDFKDFIKALGFIVNKGKFFIGRGDLVRLNTGEIALIEEMSKISALNPRIKIIKNNKLETLKRPIQVDMLKDFDSYISNVFDRSANKSTN